MRTLATPVPWPAFLGSQTLASWSASTLGHIQVWGQRMPLTSCWKVESPQASRQLCKRQVGGWGVAQGGEQETLVPVLSSGQGHSRKPEGFGSGSCSSSLKLLIQLYSKTCSDSQTHILGPNLTARGWRGWAACMTLSLSECLKRPREANANQ